MKINKKKVQKKYAQTSITSYLTLIQNPEISKYHSNYIKEIINLSKSFNIRLQREEKLQFCKHCFIPWNSNNKTIRVNSKTLCIEHACNKCNSIKRFRYK